jgi:flagellar L-ring protein precursor FlgH
VIHALILAALGLVVPLVLRAQTPQPAPAPAAPAAPAPAEPAPATQAPAAQVATAGTAATAAPAAMPLTRASWLSDRRALRVGDILTVVVDEQTAAHEQVSTDASARRSHALNLNTSVDPTNKLGPIKAFGTGSDASSRDAADARRQGDLTAVIAVRVVSLDALGNARIEGAKTVAVDGRNQEVKLAGVVRPDDVSPGYLVASNRIAEATISYKGKKIGPRMGILGKLLSILWP